MRVLAVAAGLLAAAPGAAAAWLQVSGPARPRRPAALQTSAVEILQRAAERYTALEAVCAEFAQVLRVELLAREHTSRGRICHRRPDRFALHFTEPAGDVIVADGDVVWIYYPSTDPGQVIRSRAPADAGGLDFHREFLVDPAGKYVASHVGTEAVGGRRTHVLRLTPRRPSSYRQVTVWIDAENWLVRRMEIREENETTRRLDFRRIELNPRLPADFFRFVPPPGARVIER